MIPVRENKQLLNSFCITLALTVISPAAIGKEFIAILKDSSLALSCLVALMEERMKNE